MIRVFLSLPMNGKPAKEIENEIEKMINVITKAHPFGDEKIEFIHNLYYDPVFEEMTSGVITEPLLYLSGAIDKMAFCNAIIFHPNFTTARGCEAEYDIAKFYEIPCYVISAMDKDAIRKLG